MTNERKPLNWTCGRRRRKTHLSTHNTFLMKYMEHMRRTEET
jgi:hypothetical protein